MDLSDVDSLSFDTDFVDREFDDVAVVLTKPEENYYKLEFVSETPTTVTFRWEPLSIAPPPDHYLGYKIKTAKFKEYEVILIDQFEEQVADVKKPERLYNPVHKSEVLPDGTAGPPTPLDRPDAHLVGYKIAPAGDDAPPHITRTVEVENQFGTLLLDTVEPRLLLVPAAKSLGSALDSPPSGINHFKCYRVEVPEGSKFPKGIQVWLEDQFSDTPKVFDIKKPTLLCNPVEKIREVGGEVELTPIEHPDLHLVCYEVKPAKGEEKHVSVLVYTKDQFGLMEEVQTKKEEELCLPSLKLES